MERKTWVMPMTLVQKFEANETVAATSCVQVACKSTAVGSLSGITDHGAPESPWPYGEGNFTVWGGFLSYAQINHKGDCSHKEKNIFRITGDQIEYLGELDGVVDMGGFVKRTDNGDGKIGPGDTFYWWSRDYDLIVGASSYKQYNHWGVAESADPSRPYQS